MKGCFNFFYLAWFIVLVNLTFSCHTSANIQGTCPVEPLPEDCAISTQFTSGRVAFTQLNGIYEISGTEKYGGDPYDNFNSSGSLQVELIDGQDANFLDIDCDGSVTGQGKDKISGVITKEFDNSEVCTSVLNQLPPNEMNWNIEVERTYSITGNVTAVGELELELTIDEATLTVLDDSNFIINVDCFWGEWTNGHDDIDVSGYIEKIKLLDSAYDPMTSTHWNPELTILDSQSWLEKMGQHFVLDYHNVGHEPELVDPANLPDEYLYYQYSTMLFQDTVTAELTADFQSNPKSPAITDLKLDEKKYYLLDVNVNTSVTVTVDWKESDETHQIEFTYGSTTETIDATGEETTWNFDAGESGTSIKAKAISQSGDSLEWEINTNKISVPAWAGMSTEWSGSIGDSVINYEATLDWPVSLETTQTVDTLSLMTGLWGVSGSISSEFNTNAHSDGSVGNGDLSTQANINLAGKIFSFDLNGNNSTTLTCDDLTTDGDATAQFSGLNWQKTLNPVTAIPGLAPAVCGLSGALCNLINSFGIKGEADATITGDGTFISENSEIKWGTGQLTGNLSAQISVNAIPKPLRSLANVSIEGGGSGCIEFQFSPNFDMNKLGGEVNVGAKVSFLGLGVNPSHDWPFGDTCTARFQTKTQSSQGWVPADGQLSMAVNKDFGAAVWSELPLGQNRPSGDIKLRIWDGSNWGAIQTLTNDVDADMAPAIEFDDNGNLVIVYQRSIEFLPLTTNDLDTFANGLELHYMVFNPNTNLLITTGQITTNNSNDFGPIIKRDNNDKLHVFWQRANGSHIFGDTINTVSIHSSSWDSTSQAWTPEHNVADDLSFTLGWSPASFTEGEMLVSVVLDTDQDFATANDRELFHIVKTQGLWNPPVQMTNDTLLDDSPISAFSNSGEPIILWRQVDTVMQLQGDLSANPVIAFGSAEPVLDGGIGSELSDGAVIATDDGMAIFWTESTKIQLASDIEQADWTLSGKVTPQAGAQNILNTYRNKEILNLAYLIRDFENGNTTLSDFVTPMFMPINLVPSFVFRDDFE